MSVPASGFDVRTAQAATCVAPWTSLKFDPTGQVTMCRFNAGYSLGRIRPGGDRLRAIWEGSRVAELRSAIAAGDHSLGCGECDPARWADEPRLRPAADHDGLRPFVDADWPQMMDFALSNTCNLQCVMCSGDLSSSIRSQREHRPALISPYGDEFFADLAPFLAHLRRCSFHGGEPFLGQATRRVWSMLRALDHPPAVTAITNGTVWNDHVVDDVRGLRMNIVVSIDGATAATCELVRGGVDFDSLQRNIRRFQVLTGEIGSAILLNYCVVRENVHELADLLCWASDQGLSARVIDVVDPVRFDVATLPADELVEVVRALEADERRVGDRLGGNRAVWDRAVGRLRAAARLAVDRSTATAQPVVLRLRPAPSPDLTERLMADVEERTGAAALVIRTDGAITEVVTAPWARQLEPLAWVGHDHAELLALLVEHYGVEPLIETVERPDRLPAFRLTFAGPRPVRLGVVASNDGTVGGPRDFVLSVESGGPAG